MTQNHPLVLLVGGI